MLRERLKARRLELGMTLEQVAEAIGVEKPTVQRYESGVIKKIDTITVEKLQMPCGVLRFI
jgi:transcriptional regulator with XRE-family HTH domain